VILRSFPNFQSVKSKTNQSTSLRRKNDNMSNSESKCKSQNTKQECLICGGKTKLTPIDPKKPEEEQLCAECRQIEKIGKT